MTQSRLFRMHSGVEVVLTGSHFRSIWTWLLVCWICGGANGDVPLPNAKPVPAMQVIPLPYDQASFQTHGVELTRYHFGATLRRPFLFPINGPTGRSYTRMGHPHDPITHSHHNSVWISHDNVNGHSFWADRAESQILHQKVIRYDDTGETSAMVCENHWIAAGQTLLIERRRIEVQSVGNQESLITIQLDLRAASGDPVTLGSTAFGLLGVRMAKSIGVHDGGGTIRNSEGNVDEKGPNGCFRKPARWCDYAGPVAENQNGGILLMDHPGNPGHPTPFHVRQDGWMGTCMTLQKEIQVTQDSPLRLSYRLYVHADVLEHDKLNQRWNDFSKTQLWEFEP